jgi:hypothetical protein
MNTSSSKTMWAGLVLAALVAAGLVYYYSITPFKIRLQERSVQTPSQSAAGETSDLETELGAVPVEGLDAELSDIERELAQ